MSRSCEFCGGELQELARTRNHVWVGCRHCQRSWQENIDAVPTTTPDVPVRPRTNGRFQESMVSRYMLAAGAVAVAFFVRWALKPVVGDTSPFLLFTPAVMVAAWYGGIGPAVVAMVAGALLGNHYFLRAIGEPSVEHWDHIAIFLVVSAVIAALTTVLQASRRRLAESLWLNQHAWSKAEAANQTKDDFISLISHELQTPVSVVLGWASAIRRRQLRGDALDVALDAIERNAQVQSRLVQDLLDRAKIASGRLRLEPQSISLTEILGRRGTDSTCIRSRSRAADDHHPGRPVCDVCRPRSPAAGLHESPVERRKIHAARRACHGRGLQHGESGDGDHQG